MAGEIFEIFHQLMEVIEYLRSKCKQSSHLLRSPFHHSDVNIAAEIVNSRIGLYSHQWRCEVTLQQHRSIVPRNWQKPTVELDHLVLFLVEYLLFIVFIWPHSWYVCGMIHFNVSHNFVAGVYSAISLVNCLFMTTPSEKLWRSLSLCKQLSDPHYIFSGVKSLGQ